MLGQIVVNDQRVAAGIHKIFRHRAAAIGCDVLHRRRIGGSSADYGCIFHGAGTGKLFNDLCDAGRFLPDCDVKAGDVSAALI